MNEPRPANPVFQTAFAIMAGIGIGGVILFVALTANSLLFPLPEGIDMEDTEAVRQAMEAAGVQSLVLVALGWFAAPFAGSLMSARLDPARGRLPGGVVTGFFLLSTVSSLATLPVPTWFWGVGVVAVLSGGHFGHGLGSARTGAGSD